MYHQVSLGRPTLLFSSVRCPSTEKTTVPILGQNACEKLGLIKRIDSPDAPLTKERLLEQYTDVFTGTGQYKQEYEMELNADVTPTVQPARRVPYAKYEKLKDTLEQLEKRGIMAKFDKPTDWVSNLAITEKNTDWAA